MSPRLVLESLFRIEKAIRDARDLHHFADVVNADDVRPIQDARGNGCCGTPDTLFRWRRFAVPSQGRAKKALARSAHQERIAEFRQLRKFLQQFVILREALAEADARIENDLRFRDAGFPGEDYGLAKALQYVPHGVTCK